MRASLDVLIVNWNSGRQLDACVASICAARHPGVDLRRVVVVDNASSDGSAECIERPDLPVEVIRNRTNRGFAAACNQAAAGSCSKYLLFLNPDMVLFETSLALPLTLMEEEGNAGIGICGIQCIDDAGVVTPTCSRFPTPVMILSKMLGLSRLLPAAWSRQTMTDWDHSASREVDQVMGAFLLIRRELFERLGGFDERFFVYFEEVDLTRRAAAAGFRTAFLATARALHHGAGCSNQVKSIRLCYNLESRLLYALKHFSRPSAALVLAATLLIEPCSRVADALRRRSLAACVETLDGYVRLWAGLPKLFRRSLDARRFET